MVAGAVLALVLLTVGTVAGVRWWRQSHRTDLERALAYAPPQTARFSWTDWAGVRRELDAHLDGRSPAGDVERFLSDGYDADLTSGSAMVDSATVLQQAFGFSPADVDWELLAQSTTGSVLIASTITKPATRTAAMAQTGPSAAASREREGRFTPRPP